jgi:hypothetical protein
MFEKQLGSVIVFGEANRRPYPRPFLVGEIAFINWPLEEKEVKSENKYQENRE